MTNVRFWINSSRFANQNKNETQHFLRLTNLFYHQSFLAIIITVQKVIYFLKCNLCNETRTKNKTKHVLSYMKYIVHGSKTKT